MATQSLLGTSALLGVEEAVEHLLQTVNLALVDVRRSRSDLRTPPNPNLTSGRAIAACRLCRRAFRAGSGRGYRRPVSASGRDRWALRCPGDVDLVRTDDDRFVSALPECPCSQFAQNLAEQHRLPAPCHPPSQLELQWPIARPGSLRDWLRPVGHVFLRFAENVADGRDAPRS